MLASFIHLLLKHASSTCRMNSNRIVKMLHNQKPSLCMYIYKLLFTAEHKQICITNPPVASSRWTRETFGCLRDAEKNVNTNKSHQRGKRSSPVISEMSSCSGAERSKAQRSSIWCYQVSGRVRREGGSFLTETRYSKRKEIQKPQSCQDERVDGEKMQRWA